MLGQAADQVVIDSIKKKGGLVLPLQGEAEQWEVQFQLGGRDLNDAGLADVAKLKNMVELNLRDTKITIQRIATSLVQNTIGVHKWY